MGGGSGQGPTMTSFWVSPQELDCFIIDNNGFILVSERPQEVRYRGSGIREGKSPATAGPSKERAEKQSWLRVEETVRRKRHLFLKPSLYFKIAKFRYFST